MSNKSENRLSLEHLTPLDTMQEPDVDKDGSLHHTSEEDADGAQHNQTASTWPIEELVCDNNKRSNGLHRQNSSFEVEPPVKLDRYQQTYKLVPLSDTETEYLDVIKSPEHGGSVTTDYGSILNKVNNNCDSEMIEELQSEQHQHHHPSIVKQRFTIRRRTFKIKIKASTSNNCDVKGDPVQNGIRICISPRQENDINIPNKETNSSKRVNVTVSSATTSSEVETDYEFRTALKSELKRSPTAHKVLRYLESLSDAKKRRSNESSVTPVETEDQAHMSPNHCSDEVHDEVHENPIIPVEDWTPEKPCQAVPVTATSSQGSNETPPLPLLPPPESQPVVGIIEPARIATELIEELTAKIVQQKFRENSFKPSVTTSQVQVMTQSEITHPLVTTTQETAAAQPDIKNANDTIDAEPEPEEFHDACGSSQYEDTTEFLDTSYDLPSSSNVETVDSPPSCNGANFHPPKSKCSAANVDDRPLITITQEMSSDMVVTSKVEVNKSKLKKRRSGSSGKKSKKSSPEKLISENFANEVLEQCQKQCRRSVEKRRSNESTKPLRRSGGGCSENRVHFPALSSTDQSDTNTEKSCGGPKKPPRTFSYRHQDRNNNNDVGIESSDHSVVPLAPLDLELYEEVKQKLIKFNRRSQEMIRAKAAVSDESPYYHYIGWVPPEKDTEDNFKPPTTEPTSSNGVSGRASSGWVQPLPPIPQHVYNMLHYSDDDRKTDGITTNHATAEGQYLPMIGPIQPMGPKLNIDTVDCPVTCTEVEVHTPSKESSNGHFNDFARNTRANSTPRDDAKIPEPVTRFNRVKEVCRRFLEMERKESSIKPEKPKRPIRSPKSRRAPVPNVQRTNTPTKKPCPKCEKRKRSFPAKAMKYSKEFYEASKRKLPTVFKPCNSRHTCGNKDCFSDSDMYSTPERRPYEVLNNTAPTIGDHTTDTLLSTRQPLNPHPVRQQARTSLNFNSNAPLPQSPRKNKSPIKSVVRTPVRILQKRFQTRPPEPDSPPYNTYRSYADPGQSDAATMNDILTQIRKLVEDNDRDRQYMTQLTPERDHNTVNRSQIRPKSMVEPTRPKCMLQRTASTSSDCLDREPLSQTVQADLHSVPHYAEIAPVKQKQPPLDRTVVKIKHNEKSYVVVNNDPNAIYATVVKKKSSDNLTRFIERERQQDQRQVDRTNTHTAPMDKTTSFNHQIPALVATKPFSVSDESINLAKNLNKNNKQINYDTKMLSFSEQSLSDRDKAIVRAYESDYSKARRETENYQKKFADNAIRLSYANEVMNQHLASLTDILSRRLTITSIDKKDLALAFNQNEINTEESNRDVVDANEVYGGSDDTTHSIKDADQLHGGDASPTVEDERSFHLNYDSGDNNSHNNEDGYDVVDFKKGFDLDELDMSYDIDQSEFHNYYNTKDRRQITSLDDTSSSDTPIEPLQLNESFSVPEKPARSNLRRGTIYRSFRNTLQSSFRKGKDFIRNEQGRIVKLFEPKIVSGENLSSAPSHTFFGLDEYKRHYNDKNAEKVYDLWRARLNSPESPSNVNERLILELVRQITTQRTIKKQLKIALNLCRSSKEFESSAELIEAERLLLVSNLKEAAAKRELLEIEGVKQYANVNQPGQNFGTVTFTDFEFPLRDAALYDTLYNYFYVVVCTYKDQVKASYSKERVGSKVIFKNFEIKFWEVQADYQIKVEVFVLCLRKINPGASSDGRFHTLKNVSKMSPKRFFNSPAKSPTKSPSFESEFSQFISQGYVYVTSTSMKQFDGGDNPGESDGGSVPYYPSNNFNQQLKKAGSHYIHSVEDFRGFRMTQMAYNSHLQGQLIMGIKNEVIFEYTEVTGFLTVGEQIQGAMTWNRRWCKLDGVKLKFWNYPQDVGSSPKDPISFIDLAKSEHSQVHQADRSLCPRPRSIVVKINLGNNYGDDTRGLYFLVADNKPEFKLWMREINKTLKFIKDWNIQ